MPALVIVNDLNVLRSCRGPAEADPPLVADADAVLTRTVTLECFESIPWWGTEEFQRCSRFELDELPGSHLTDRPEASRFARFEELASVAALEALDHRIMV